MKNEYQRFYESDDRRPSFAGTDTIFEIGDNVLVDGKEYQIEGFYRSMYAEPNQVDWLRIGRTGISRIWNDVHPSEATLLSRPVLEREAP